MRRIRVIANWKMNGDRAMVTSLLDALTANLRPESDCVVVCPPSPYLDQAQKLLASSKIGLGAQNVHAKAQGAYTGEISIGMLRDFGCTHVLVGHSERRTLFAESDRDVAEKFAALVEAQIKPVLCVGESAEQRASGSTETIVLQQIDAVLQQVGVAGFRQALIAYEPVWAIGTGDTATPEQAQAVHAAIRARIAGLDADLAEALPILYGGSVTAMNASSLFAMNDIDGALVGGASLDSKAFAEICGAAG